MRQGGNSTPGNSYSGNNSRLGSMLDIQYQQPQQPPQPPQQQQQRRLNSSSFDNSNSFPSGQSQLSAQAPSYTMNGGAPGLLNESSYGSLSLGTYDSNGVDWNANAGRSGVPLPNSGNVGSVGGLVNPSPNSRGQPQYNNSFFQPQPAQDWSLRSGEPLGLQTSGNGFGMPDMGHLSQQQTPYGQAVQQPNARGPGSSNGNRGFQTAVVPSPPLRGNGYLQSPSSNHNNPGTGGSNAQGRALNKMLLDILRERTVDPNRLAMAIDANIERMDCVNLATLLFHTGKKRLLLTPSFIKRIAIRFSTLKEELRARESSNALYGLKCMSSECPEVRQLVFALASKVGVSMTELVAQAVGNALYGCQMMTSDHEEVRYLLQVLSVKVAQCTELLEAQNVGNALYGLRGMNSDVKEVRMLIAALTPKIATAREELNGQALGNSLYGLQGMNSREPEVRALLSVLATKVSRTWEDLKAQEVGNALYGLKRMNSDCTEVRQLIEALVPKVASSPEILDAQAIGNSFYGMQNMKSDNVPVLMLLATMAEKVNMSPAELDGQAMGNSLYGMQGMRSEQAEVRAVINAITLKTQASCLEMNAQELGNALYGIQRMTSDWPEVRKLLAALTHKVGSSKHELTSQEIGNALFGLQGMKSDVRETRALVRQLANKISQSTSLIDPQGIANSLFGVQKMTSDSEEVRTLLQVLAVKIEQSWKLLSAQHVSNSIFGMQGCCSSESEVRALIHALVPKVLASRDEMSPKQVCNALYAIKNFFSAHEEVRSLLGPLAEKVTMCNQPIPLTNLSAAFFGLQGLDSEHEEARALLLVLCEKLAVVDEIDAFSLGNCLFGLQRMSSSYSEVLSALELFSPMIQTLSDAGLELGAKVCANIIYGLQNASVQEECVRKMVVVVLNKIKENIASYSQMIVPGGNVDSTSLFADLLLLHQALALAVQSMSDLHLDSELHEEVRAQRQQLYTIVSSRKLEHVPRPLTTAESRLAESIADALVDEPFIVSTGELLHGFDAVITIRLRPGLPPLITEDGQDWNPVLNIEVGTPADSYPHKELFNRLRASYLGSEFGVAVQVIPSSAIIGKSRSALRECLRRSTDLFTSLYPPSHADGIKFAATLSALGVCRPDDILASLRLADGISSETDSSGSFFSMGSGDSFGDFDDGLDGLDSSLAEYFESRGIQTGPRGPGTKNTGSINPLGWIGDSPLPSTSVNNTPSSSPSTHYLTPHPMLQRRQQQQAHFKVITSPLPTGVRNVNPPFIQVGPPAIPAALPSSLVSNYGNANAVRVPLQQQQQQLQQQQQQQQQSQAYRKPTVAPVPAPAPPVSTQYTAPASATSHLNSLTAAQQVSSLSVSVPYSMDSDAISPKPVSSIGSLTSGVQSAPLSGPPSVVPTFTPTVRNTSSLDVSTPAVEDDGPPADDEIALLEAQLEIKRMEARLLQLKKAKK